MRFYNRQHRHVDDDDQRATLAIRGDDLLESTGRRIQLAACSHAPSRRSSSTTR